MKHKLIYIIGGSLVAGSLMFGGSAFAADANRVTPAVFGSVIAVTSGGITVSGKSGKRRTTTTYTVDVSKAKITTGLGQGASVVTPSNVEVGDKVAVLGVITGDAMFASSVFDRRAAATSKQKRM
ncbi:MAG: hypothetical protein ABSE76_02125 [Minisyncoccia bacterium]|jgi:hypothetical protein